MSLSVAFKNKTHTAYMEATAADTLKVGVGSGTATLQLTVTMSSERFSSATAHLYAGNTYESATLIESISLSNLTWTTNSIPVSLSVTQLIKKLNTPVYNPDKVYLFYTVVASSVGLSATSEPKEIGDSPLYSVINPNYYGVTVELQDPNGKVITGSTIGNNYKIKFSLTSIVHGRTYTGDTSEENTHAYPVISIRYSSGTQQYHDVASGFRNDTDITYTIPASRTSPATIAYNRGATIELRLYATCNGSWYTGVRSKSVTINNLPVIGNITSDSGNTGDSIIVSIPLTDSDNQTHSLYVDGTEYTSSTAAKSGTFTYPAAVGAQHTYAVKDPFEYSANKSYTVPKAIGYVHVYKDGAWVAGQVKPQINGSLATVLDLQVMTEQGLKSALK